MSDPWRAPDQDSAWTPPPAPPDSTVGSQSGPAGSAAFPPVWFPSPLPQPLAEPAEDAAEQLRLLREHLLTFTAPFVAMLLLGAPLGLLWAWFTPRIGVVETAAGLALTSPEGKSFFAVDGWFFVMSIAVGIVAAVGVWLALRGRSPLVPAGLVAGALVGAQIAREIGGRIVVDDRVHRFCTAPGASCPLYDGTLSIRASGVLLVWALVAVSCYLVLTALFDREPVAPPAWPPPGSQAGAPWRPAPDAKRAAPDSDSPVDNVRMPL